MPIETHELKCDIVVAGGGAAGVPCALAAARCGAKVVLCQDRPVLGGNASSEVRMHIVGANGTGSFDRGVELETEAREGGIIEEIRLENCVRNPQRSASMFDLILYDKCRTEANLTLLLNTTVTSVDMENGRIISATAERPSTEDRFTIHADVFIDCTGDGRLGVEAGAVFMEGREARAQFDESLAVVESDKARLGSTILLQARKHEYAMPFVAPVWARRFSKSELRLRLYANPGEEKPSHEYGYWWAEWGGTLDTIKDNEAIRDELMSVALGIWDHVKNGPCESESSDDSFQASHWALEWIGFLPGKRESRRFIGQHVLAQQDVIESRQFSDSIAYGGWSLDLHPPEGIDVPDEQPCQQHHVPFLFDIPLRCCVARDVSNLMFAGRNISATHVAFSSTRVMATCAVVGQGVGTAAAFAVNHQLSAAELAGNDMAISTIQQRLLRDDVFLIGCTNSDAEDVARRATISASSATLLGDPLNVISGATRAVHGERGVVPDRCVSGSHRWMSDPEAGLPASLQLEWDRSIRIGAVMLVFDVGLHRHLTLSHHNGYSGSMCWGSAQPETVRDYTVSIWEDGGWENIVTERGNFHRLRCHQLSAARQARRMRIDVTGTNGLDHARIVEVRVYENLSQWS